MKLLKADNYQTWYIEEGNKAILIDPWLSNQLQPDGSLFIQRIRDTATVLDQEKLNNVQAIIITAPFEDHLHIDSIKSFKGDVKIYTSRLIKRMLLKANIKNPIYILDNKGTDICSINIRALPTGFPYHPATFALLIKDINGNTIFHEGHIAKFRFLLKNQIKADVAILTAEEVKLLGFLRLGMDYKRTLRACRILGAKSLFITGSNPEDTKGIIGKFLLVKPLEKEKLETHIALHHQAGDYINLT